MQIRRGLTEGEREVFGFIAPLYFQHDAMGHLFESVAVEIFLAMTAPVNSFQFPEAMQSFIERKRIDNAGESGCEGPLILNVADHFSHEALLINRDADDVVGIKI